MGLAAWPLFDLVLSTPRLTMRTPTDDDLPGLLEAVEAGIHDPAEMPFSVPWTDDRSPQGRARSLQHWWANRANWSVDEWHLSLAVFQEGRPIGVQELFALRFPVLREVTTGSWLTRAAQGQGIGKEMRSAALDLAFDGLGAAYAHSGAFEDNYASAAVSRALGYRPNGFRREAPRGEPRRLVNYVLTREEWLEARAGRAAASIKGLEACLPMFGLG